MTSPRATRAALDAAGLNLSAALERSEYDAIVPEAWRAPDPCRSVLVVGNAGPLLWRLAVGTGGRNPLDDYVEQVLRECARDRFASYRERRDGRPLPLVRLAAAAGIGVPGRIGLLLHPTYGPWISLRAVVYSEEDAEPRERLEFDPCTGCPAPCVGACRGSAVGVGFDGEQCFRTKLLDRGCRVACDARAACVLGPEHAFPPDAIAHHSRLQWTPGLALRAARVLLRRKP